MNGSELRNEIYAALSRAQAEIKPAKLDCYNTFLKSKYSSLSAIQDAYKGPLEKNGLALMQFVESNENGFQLNTTLAHSSGQEVSTTFKMILQKEDMQGLGSAITYARRYAISAMLGIVDSDDDGVNAQAINSARSEVKEAVKAKVQEKVDQVKSMGPFPGGSISVTKLVEQERQKLKAEKAKVAVESNITGPSQAQFDEIADAFLQPGEYKILFGNNKGKKLKELSETSLRAQLDWAEKDTQPPRTKNLENFISYAKLHLASLAK